jgi:hypothetical protein
MTPVQREEVLSAWKKGIENQVPPLAIRLLYYY